MALFNIQSLSRGEVPVTIKPRRIDPFEKVLKKVKRLIISSEKCQKNVKKPVLTPDG